VQTPKNTRDIVTIGMALSFVFLGAGAAQPFVVDYLHDVKGFTTTQASFVLSLVYFVFVVFWLLIGAIIDLIGMQRVKILGIATYALFPFIVYAADSYPVLLMGSVMWGIGAAMMWTSSMVQIMNSAPPGRTASSTGIVKCAEMTAAFVGLYLLSWCYDRFGYEKLFLLAAALGVGGILSMLASPKRQVGPGRPSLSKFMGLMRKPGTKTVCLLLFSSGFAYGIILNGAKPYIELQCGKEWLKWVLPVFPMTGIFASLFGGFLCDRIGRWATFVWAFGLGALGMFLAANTSLPFVLMLAMLAIGVQNTLAPLSALGWIADNTKPHERPQVMGFVMCFRDLGVALTIQLGGAFADTKTALILFGTLSAICSAAAFRSLRRRAREAGQGAA
jgi:MFS family permease